MSVFSKAKSFFAAHKAARVMLAAAVILLALVLICHPHGAKTFLIMGIDNYGSLNDSGRSDVMMLVQVGFDSGKIHAVTFARDIVVPNESGKNVKLNTVVRTQDEDALVDTMNRVFDLNIDGWFRVNFSSVITIIDAMGGVEVELTDAEAHYIDNKEGVYPEYLLSEGVCRLNGAQALCYARCHRPRRQADQALLRAGETDKKNDGGQRGFRRPKHEPRVAVLPEQRRTGQTRL